MVKPQTSGGSGSRAKKEEKNIVEKKRGEEGRGPGRGKEERGGRLREELLPLLLFLIHSAAAGSQHLAALIRLNSSRDRTVHTLKGRNKP